MKDRIHVKPAPGLIVRHPDTLAELEKAGEFVRPSKYWRRRLKAGDVLLVEEKAPKKTTKTSPKASTKAPGEEI